MSRVSQTKKKSKPATQPTKAGKTEKVKKHVKTKETPKTGRKKVTIPPAARNTRTTVASDDTKKKRRHRPGVAAMIAIRRLQKTTNLLLRVRPFRRLIRFETQNADVPSESNWSPSETRFSAEALEAVQNIIEDIITKVNSDAGRDAVAHGLVRPRAKTLFYVSQLRYNKIFDGVEREAEALPQ